MGSLEDEIRQDGHTLLLIEVKPGERTYSDYQNVATCLTNIVHMYEGYCEEIGRKGGDLMDFYKWLDEFYRLELLAFDRDISRYRLTNGQSLKNLFESKDDGSYKHVHNGHHKPSEPSKISLNSCSINGAGDMESDDDEENWDD